jgi:hypothetical protein
MLCFILYIISIIILMLTAIAGHEVGDYLVSTDKMAEHKVALNEQGNKKWNWREVLHLLFSHKPCTCGDKHMDARKDYLRSWKWNIAHAVSYILSIGVLFVFTSYLLEFAAARKFGAEFNPVELIGWGYFVGWMVINAVLHGFIDRRWPIKMKMIHTGQEAFFNSGVGAAMVDQASHKFCLYLTTFAIPVIAALLS